VMTAPQDWHWLTRFESTKTVRIMRSLFWKHFSQRPFVSGCSRARWRSSAAGS
jgi:hypothetical protein